MFDGIGEYDVDLTTELVEDLGKGKDGADGVAVGARVGGKEKAGIGTKGGQKQSYLRLMMVGCMSLEFLELRFGCHDLDVTA